MQCYKVLNAIPEGILVLDKDLNIIMENKASQKLLKESNYSRVETPSEVE